MKVNNIHFELSHNTITASGNMKVMYKYVVEIMIG